MKKFLFLIALLFAIPAFADTSYLSAIDDVPLPDGFTEQADRTTTFDTAQGRVVETYIEGDATWDQALHYYDDTLTKLGWQKTGAALYRRNDEELQLAAVPDTDDLVIRFTLSPIP